MPIIIGHRHGYGAVQKGDTFPVDIHQVVDGDVLEVSVLGTSGAEERRIEAVRLYGIDAPESTQKYWSEAVSHLESLVQEGRFLLRVVDVDEYGVITGDVYRNSPDESLSQDMVKAGWAYWRRDCVWAEWKVIEERSKSLTEWASIQRRQASSKLGE